LRADRVAVSATPRVAGVVPAALPFARTRRGPRAFACTAVHWATGPCDANSRHTRIRRFVGIMTRDRFHPPRDHRYTHRETMPSLERQSAEPGLKPRSTPRSRDRLSVAGVAARGRHKCLTGALELRLLCGFNGCG
jgi:hypothetical protein